jgi:hypothetical protein
LVNNNNYYLVYTGFKNIEKILDQISAIKNTSIIWKIESKCKIKFKKLSGGIIFGTVLAGCRLKLFYGIIK